MKKHLNSLWALCAALFSGLIFGLGLILAGMANPAKVLGFLDITGAWDPSLALVMCGAITIGAIAFTIAKKRQVTFLGLNLHLPTAHKADIRLALGSILFGIGWGLSGICPGPALVLLGTGIAKGFYFASFMLLGMLIFAGLELWRSNKRR
ncbi:MAG: YeeE/YedE family protein [Methylotenera sp.]|nr:YeeE/YedE family protein [Methylotenera sp.]